MVVGQYIHAYLRTLKVGLGSGLRLGLGLGLRLGLGLGLGLGLEKPDVGAILPSGQKTQFVPPTPS